MVDMEPVIAPFMTQIAFRLGDLIGVVGESIVNAAGVDIQILPRCLMEMQEHSICQPG